MRGSAENCTSIFLATLMLLYIIKNEKKIYLSFKILWLTKIGNFGVVAQF